MGRSGPFTRTLRCEASSRPPRPTAPAARRLIGTPPYSILLNAFVPAQADMHEIGRAAVGIVMLDQVETGAEMIARPRQHPPARTPARGASVKKRTSSSFVSMSRALRFAGRLGCDPIDAVVLLGDGEVLELGGFDGDRHGVCPGPLCIRCGGGRSAKTYPCRRGEPACRWPVEDPKWTRRGAPRGGCPGPGAAPQNTARQAGDRPRVLVSCRSV